MSYKNHDENAFMRDLDSGLIEVEAYKNNENPYDKLSQIFRGILEYHAHLK